jgi:hypothetical protein
VQRVRRGNARRRGRAHRTAPAPRARALQGRRAAAAEEARRKGAEVYAKLAKSAWWITTTAARSAADTAGRTRSARPCA